MPKPEIRHKAVLSHAAREDIRTILSQSVTSFGARAAARYLALLNQALHDLETDPARPGTRTHPALVEGARLYHVSISRSRGHNQVKAPRHQIVFRVTGRRIEIVRILHDRSDMLRHLPEDYLA